MVKEYGFETFFETQLETINETLKLDDYLIGRVIIDYGNGFKIQTDEGLYLGHISGKLRHNETLYPVIGDFVIVTKADSESVVIHKVLTRKTAFSRKIAGDEFKEQVQGANFDYMFIISSLNKDLNMRKLERYIITAWNSGATPVVVLTKLDICDDLDEYMSQVEEVALGVNIHCVSSLYGTNMDELEQYLIPGKTIALFGSSGVGKSTLINKLYGEDHLKVNAQREDDDRGRHTTSHREIIKLPNGTLLMDTPGMRELGLWDDGSGVDHTFEDIVTLTKLCKFNDCKHNSEPGCAVKEAINNGELTEKRYKAYVKLQKEALYIKRKAARKLRGK